MSLVKLIQNIVLGVIAGCVLIACSPFIFAFAVAYWPILLIVLLLLLVLPDWNEPAFTIQIRRFEWVAECPVKWKQGVWYRTKDGIYAELVLEIEINATMPGRMHNRFHRKLDDILVVEIRDNTYENLLKLQPSAETIEFINKKLLWPRNIVKLKYIAVRSVQDIPA